MVQLNNLNPPKSEKNDETSFISNTSKKSTKENKSILKLTEDEIDIRVNRLTLEMYHKFMIEFRLNKKKMEETLNNLQKKEEENEEAKEKIEKIEKLVVEIKKKQEKLKNVLGKNHNDKKEENLKYI